jgi:hypothetical protein
MVGEDAWEYWMAAICRHFTKSAIKYFDAAVPREVHVGLPLVAAYVISVCLYINIPASFVLGGIGEQYDTILNEHIISVIVILAFGLVGS